MYILVAEVVSEPMSCIDLFLGIMFWSAISIAIILKARQVWLRLELVSQKQKERHGKEADAWMAYAVQEHGDFDEATRLLVARAIAVHLAHRR